jgi:hypothetical protein
VKYKTVICREIAMLSLYTTSIFSPDFIIKIIAFKIKSFFHYLKVIATANMNRDGRLSMILGKLKTGDLKAFPK